MLHMPFKENMKHPNFMIGALSFIFLLVGVILKGNGYSPGNYVIIASIIMGFIHWIWSIADVAVNNQMDAKSRTFWFTIVIIIPPLGGMFYYMMKSKNVHI